MIEHDDAVDGVVGRLVQAHTELETQFSLGEAWLAIERRRRRRVAKRALLSAAAASVVTVGLVASNGALWEMGGPADPTFSPAAETQQPSESQAGAPVPAPLQLARPTGAERVGTSGETWGLAVPVGNLQVVTVQGPAVFFEGYTFTALPALTPRLMDGPSSPYVSWSQDSVDEVLDQVCSDLEEALPAVCDPSFERVAHSSRGEIYQSDLGPEVDETVSVLVSGGWTILAEQGPAETQLELLKHLEVSSDEDGFPEVTSLEAGVTISDAQQVRVLARHSSAPSYDLWLDVGATCRASTSEPGIATLCGRGVAARAEAVPEPVADAPTGFIKDLSQHFDLETRDSP